MKGRELGSGKQNKKTYPRFKWLWVKYTWRTNVRKTQSSSLVIGQWECEMPQEALKQKKNGVRTLSKWEYLCSIPNVMQPRIFWVHTNNPDFICLNTKIMVMWWLNICILKNTTMWRTQKTGMAKSWRVGWATPQKAQCRDSMSSLRSSLPREETKPKDMADGCSDLWRKT